MTLRPPRSTRTDTLFPYTPLFLSNRAPVHGLNSQGASSPSFPLPSHSWRAEGAPWLREAQVIARLCYPPMGERVAGSFESLEEIRRNRSTVAVRCGFCEHRGVVDGGILRRGFALHHWESRPTDENGRASGREMVGKDGWIRVGG